MGLPSSLRAADPAPDHERLGNCGKLNEDLPPAGQPPSGALARNKHQILVHTLRTIFRRCMRRGVVTKKVCPGFQVWGGAKKSIQQRHSNNQSNTQSKSKSKSKSYDTCTACVSVNVGIRRVWRDCDGCEIDRQASPTSCSG